MDFFIYVLVIVGGFFLLARLRRAEGRLNAGEENLARERALIGALTKRVWALEQSPAAPPPPIPVSAPASSVPVAPIVEPPEPAPRILATSVVEPPTPVPAAAPTVPIPPFAVVEPPLPGPSFFSTSLEPPPVPFAPQPEPSHLRHEGEEPHE